MRESTTYQAILQEGRQEGIIVGRHEGIIVGRHEGVIEGEQQALLRLGTKRFGLPDPATVTAIGAIQDIGRLGALIERTVALDIHGWDELLREEGSVAP